MQDLLADVRAAWRGWQRTPVVAITIVATLACAVGLAAAIFSFADGYLFRPLPFPGADRVFSVTDPNARIALLESDTAILRHSELALLGFVEWSVSRRLRSSEVFIGDRPVEFFANGVQPGFRQTLPLPLVIGRDFAESDHVDGSTVPVWLGHRFWLREMGGDPNVVGRTYKMRGSDGQSIAVVGVLGPAVASFDLNNRPPDAVVAEVPSPAVARNANRLSFPLVRLPETMSVAQAEAAMATVLQRASPAVDGRPRVIRLRSLLQSQTAGGRPTARVLMAGAVLILLLAAINLVHLLLARGVARAGEVATRTALGAGRWRVIRMFLVESLLLGVTGIASGLWLGALLSRAIDARLPQWPTAGRNLALVPIIYDLRVMAFAAMLGLIVTVIGGLWPAWRASRRPLTLNARSTGGVMMSMSTTTSRIMLASEVAVAAAVVMGTLFIGTGIWRYLHQPLGYSYRDRFAVSAVTAGDAPLAAADREAVERALAAVPAVRAVGPRYLSSVKGVEVPGSGANFRNVTAQMALPGYFETWAPTLAIGRWFEPKELAGDEPVAVVDAQLASIGWPGASALGQQITVAGVARRVIGVTATWRGSLSRLPEGRVWVTPHGATDRTALAMWAPGMLVAQLQASAASAASAVVPGARLRVESLTLEDLFLREVGEAQFQAPIVGVFGILAFLLAAVGVFGLISFIVERRLREFGIRIALGAAPNDIRALVLTQSARPVMAGVLIGIASAYALESVVRASIFGWPASQPLSIGLAAATILVVALLAASVPARRAMRVDPAVSLRAE